MGQGTVLQETSQGNLLGGRVAYKQLRAGHRTGFEPVLLAASVPAAPGELVLEAGTGAGAALLCLAARVAGVVGVGVEIAPVLARLAAENFAANGFAGLSAVVADAAALPFREQSFDHVLANPPWFGARNTESPDRLRALAHMAGGDWLASLTAVLRPKGSISLILPAGAFVGAVAALRGQYGGITLLPLWPRAGAAAKLVILRARKGSRSPDRVCSGLVLHDGAGITREAQEVLREGKPVAFDPGA